MKHASRYLFGWFLLIAWPAAAELTLSTREAQFLSSVPVLKIMADDTFIPLSRWNPATNDYEGISVDVFRQAAARLGLRYEFIHDTKLTWNSKLGKLLAGEVDVMLPVSWTDERAQKGLFAGPHYETYYGAVALRDRNLELPKKQDWGRWRFGATEGAAVVSYLNDAVGAEKVTTFATTRDLYQAVTDRTIDFAFQNLLVFREDRYNDELFDLAVVGTLADWPRTYAFYLPPTPQAEELVPLLDRAVESLDTSPVVSRYERGEEDLILRYLNQTRRQSWLLAVLGASGAGIVALALILWSQRRRRESEERFRALSEASFGGITIHDNGVILECNQGLADMTGYSRDELIGMNGLLLVTAASRETVLANIRAGYSLAYEVEGLRKDGSLYPVGIRGRNTSYRGRAARVTEFTDLTGQKRAEAATEKAKRQYDQLVAKIPVGVYVFRSRPDGGASFDYVSPPMTEMVGMTAEQLLGDAAAAEANLHPDDRTEFLRLNAERVAARVPFDWQGRFVVDGQTRWLSISSVPDPQDNGDVLWHGLMVDITERKASNDRIRALLEEKDLILREVHHRIKNNMSTVSGLLTLQAATLNDPVAVAALEDAKGRILSMMVLYEKLYEASDNREVSLASYLPDLVSEILGNFPNVAMVRYQTDAEDIVLGAQKLSTLGIIVNELLTNTMKYAFQGRSSGTIAVKAQRVEGGIRLSVEDDGLGLPEDFDLTKSTGFGLVLIDMLTKSLKGNLTVERNPGTRFVLEFPS